jgi:hypothetical protein
MFGNYFEEKRSRGVFTEPEFDVLIEPEPQVPAKTIPTIKKEPKQASVIDQAIAIKQARNSGLSDKQVEAVGEISKIEGGADFVSRNLPSTGKPSTYAQTAPPADVLSSMANGLANTFVGFNAGRKQLTAQLFGNLNDKEAEAIRQWQRENEVQVNDATKRIMNESLYDNGEVNWTKFGYGMGNAMGSAAISIGAAVALAPFGVGAVAAGAAGAAASYPMIFNSTFNSAMDAGYSAEDAAKFAHQVSVPISLIEIFPLAKIGRTLAPRTIADLTEKFLVSSMKDSSGKIASKIAKDGLTEDLLLGAYKSVKNGVRDRLLVNGGVLAENSLLEGGTEVIQNYMERYGEVLFDKNNPGKGRFGTTMDDVTGKKQLYSAMEDGLFGFMGGGAVSSLSVMRPTYEMGVYNTLAKADQKGKFDKGLASIIGSVEQSVADGKLNEQQAQSAIESINQVAASYKKIGQGIDDPKIKAAVYYGIKTKDSINAEIQKLTAKKEQVAQQIASGEIDPDVASFEDQAIDRLVEKKNKQMAVTSDWLKETTGQIYANRINAGNAQVANVDEFVDEVADGARQVKDSQSFWKKAMGFTPNFASTRIRNLSDSLNEINKQYEAQEGIFSKEALKDSNLDSDFDVFERASKIIDDEVPTKGNFVTDGEGNYAMEVEVDTEGGKKKMYRPIAKSEYYSERLKEIFSANKMYDTIAGKIAIGQALDAKQQEVYRDFKPDIDEVVAAKKQKFDETVSSSILNYFTTGNLKLEKEGPLLPFDSAVNQGVTDGMAQMKVLSLSLKKAKEAGDAKAIAKLKKDNPNLGSTIDYLQNNEDILEQLSKKEPKEKKSKKKPAERTEAKKAEVKKEVETNLGKDGTQQVKAEPLSGDSPTKATANESTGNPDTATLGVAVEKADVALETANDVKPASNGEYSADDIQKLGDAIGEVLNSSDEVDAKEPGNADSDGGAAQSGENGQRIILGQDEELNNFIEVVAKVFPTISIEVVPDAEWNNIEILRPDANGAFVGNKVYIREDGGNMKGVLLQELGHVFVAAVEKSAPKLYRDALKAIEGTEYYQKVEKRYGLEGDAAAREALGWAIQDKAEQIIDETKKADMKNLLDRILTSVKRSIKNLIKNFDPNNEKMTLDLFTRQAAEVVLGNSSDEEMTKYLNEFRPDPNKPAEYSLYGNFQATNYQASQLGVSQSGQTLTPMQTHLNWQDINSVITGRTRNQTPASVERRFINTFEPLLSHPKATRWTQLTSADLSSPEAMTMYDEIANRQPLTNDSAKLLRTLEKDLKKYNKWVIGSHAKVIDATTGQEQYAYIDHVYESELVNKNVNTLKGANTGFWGKINQFFLSDYFTNLFGYSSVAEFLGGDSGMLSGVNGLMRKRNNDAATFAKAADSDIIKFKEKLKGVFGLKVAEDYFNTKVTIDAFNNMDGNPQQVSMEIPLGMAADILVNYQTQSKNAPGGVLDRTHSSMYYNPAISGRGAQVPINGKVVYRGITQQIEDNEYNLLFDDTQLAQLEALFAPGTQYEFLIKDSFDFYSGTAGVNGTPRFDMVNDVYINVKGESLQKLPNGQYAPTRAYADSSNASHRTMGAAYDDVSFIKPRTDLPGRLQGSGDVLRAMESYNRRAQNFIRNAESAESLLSYTRRVKDKWNNKEMRQKLNWLDDFRDDLDSYEQKRIIQGQEDKILFGYRKLMSNFAKSVFAFNLANPVKQAVGYLSGYGLGIVENKYLDKYRGFVANNTRKSFRGYLQDENNSAYAEVYREIREIQSYDKLSDVYLRLEDSVATTQGIPMGNIYSAYSSGEKGAAIKQFFAQSYDDVVERGLRPMRFSDKVPIVAFYKAAKDQVRDMAASGQLLDTNGNAVAFESNGRMTPEAEDLVGRKVTELVYKTTNMYMLNDKTGLQRSFGVFQETIGLFSSQPQKIFNLFLQNLFSAARGNFQDPATTKLLQSSAWHSIFVSSATTAAITVSYQILRNGMYEDDDDMYKDFATEMGKNIIGIAPSIGTEALVGLISIFDSRKSVDSLGQNPVMEQITKMIVGLNSYKESLSEDGQMRERLEDKAIGEFVTGLGAISGTPSIFPKILRNLMEEKQ